MFVRYLYHTLCGLACSWLESLALRLEAPRRPSSIVVQSEDPETGVKSVRVIISDRVSQSDNPGRKLIRGRR